MQHALDEQDPAAVTLLDHVLVDFTVRLGQVSMTVGALERLRVGELILLEEGVEDSLALLVGGRPFGAGEVVSLGHGRYGLRILELVRPPSD